MIRKLMMCLILILANAMSPALTQEPNRAPESRLPAVVVTGARPEEARAFVKEVMPEGWAAATRGVPRWNDELCVSAIGPAVEHGQFIADRITERAIAVGLQAGAPGCETNLLVIVTNKRAVLLPAIAEKHRSVFGFTGDANIDTGGSGTSLAGFLADARPVSWRQVIETIGADGMPLDGDPRRGITMAPENVPTVRTDSTRLRSAVRRQLSRVVAVVDTTQTTGLGLGAISDYLAFVTLADVGAEADLSAFPSILNLFNPNGERQLRMTDWDLAFLDSLYAANLEAASGSMQYREIANRMVEQRTGGE